MKTIKKLKLQIQRHSYLAIAAQFAVLVLASAIFPFSSASAVQLTNRYIQLSDSGASANSSITSGVGSGTTVAYKVSFRTTNTSAIGGIVIDFCSNTPLIGDSCTAPTGFNVNRSTTTLSNQSSNLNTGTFAPYTSDSTNNRIILTRATATAPTSTTGDNSFELGNGTSNGFTNPSSTGTFYARVYTYATATAAQGHNTGTPTGYLDSGGIALSIANVITITARVQENLIFCVSAAAPTANCGGTTSPALSIGHVTTGTVKYIDSSAIDTASAYTQLSTNAGFGAIVRMHSSSTTGGLDNGANSIPPGNSGANTPAAFTAGTAAFGLYVGPSSLASPGVGTVTPDANYNDGTATHYGMDSTTSGTNVTTTYGDAIASSSGAVSNVNTPLTFAATASNVTPAGLYSANLAMIATGTF